MSKTQKIAVAVVTAALVAGIVFCGLGWKFTQQDLDSARIKLSSTQAALESTERELADTKDELLTTKAELKDTKNYLSTVETELQATQAKLSAIQADTLHLHNPTFEEVTNFLKKDKTDSNKYIKGEYVCSHFARDVNNNAESQGIRCAFVDIRFPKMSHTIIAFDTTDEGIVYFDAITDERVRLVIGEKYWRCIEPKTGYYYVKPSYNDTIVDILLIW